MGHMESDIKTTALTVSGAITTVPARIKAIHYVGGAAAGTLVIRDGGVGGPIVATINTAAGVAEAGYMLLPGNGIRCEISAYCVVTTTAFATFFWA